MKCDAEWHGDDHTGRITRLLLPNQVRVLVPRMSVAASSPASFNHWACFFLHLFALIHRTWKSQYMEIYSLLQIVSQLKKCVPQYTCIWESLVALIAVVPMYFSTFLSPHFWLPYPWNKPFTHSHRKKSTDVISGKCGDVEIVPPRSVHLPEDLFRQEMSPHFYASFAGGGGGGGGVTLVLETLLS